MSASPDKTFYLETFGCQMNAHDSEKVVARCCMRGIGRWRRWRRLGWFCITPVRSAIRLSRKFFNRLNDFKKYKKQGKSLACWGVWRSRRREDL